MKAPFLIISLLLPCFAAAQTAAKICPPPLAQLTSEQWIEKAKIAKNSGFLWKVEKNGLTSWLYGTIHVNSLELAMPGPIIVNAIKGVDIVALELDLSTRQKAQNLVDEVSKSQLNSKPLDVKTRARIKVFFDSMCMPVESFLKLPVPVLKAVLPTQAMRDKGLYPELMVDGFIGGLGVGLKKQVIALESVQGQIRALDSSSETLTSEAALDGTLRSLETGEAQKFLATAFEVWSRSDWSRFEQFFEWCECVKTAKEQEQMMRFNDDRNVLMAKQIVQMLNDSKRLFVAVGSLHMIGQMSLPILLRKNGFVVTYVPFIEKN
jgi:uncharacterized protein